MEPAMDVSVTADILPKFRAGDVSCMARGHVNLGGAAWICDPAAGAGYADRANARRVFSALSQGKMPPNGRWPPEWLATYQGWMDSGFHP
jgi:hypothetical protein